MDKQGLWQLFTLSLALHSKTSSEQFVVHERRNDGRIDGRFCGYSLAASHSLESIDVVGARGLWGRITARAGRIAPLHGFEHLSASAIAHTVG